MILTFYLLHLSSTKQSSFTNERSQMHLMRSIPITVISNNWEVIKTAWPAVTTHQIITEKNIINNQLWRFMKISPKGGHNICDCLADRFLMPSYGHLNWNKYPRERSIDPILLKGKHRVADESGWVTQKVCVVVVVGCHSLCALVHLSRVHLCASGSVQ